ncbi:hypothetical protein ABBQ38_005039 [Trebouxia sp. C0009 RCD-2024]
MSYKEAAKLFGQFQAAVNKNDLQGAKRLLSTLKIQLTQLPSLPPVLGNSPDAAKELTLARDTLELAVFLSVKMQDEAAFERNYQQLQMYVSDTRGLLSVSKQQNLITGLNLLRLLVQNRIAEFHTELELIPQQVQQEAHIKHATELEQQLMEGAYNKVLSAKSNVPDQSYLYFMDKLISTVRDEIASCSERAYKQLSVPEAQKLMLFTSSREAAEFAEQRGWQVKGNVVYFEQQEQTDMKDLPAVELMNHTLTYARELERIV